MTTATQILLLVDDEPDIAASLAMYLEACIPEISCDTAENGDEALQMAGGSDYAMVISDFRMPGMSGLDLLREIRQRSPKVPCVLFTAYPDREIAHSALDDVQVDLFLQKPIEPDAMVAAVQTSLSLQVDAEGGVLLAKAKKDIQNMMR